MKKANEAFYEEMVRKQMMQTRRMVRLIHFWELNYGGKLAAFHATSSVAMEAPNFPVLTEITTEDILEISR